VGSDWSISFITIRWYCSLCIYPCPYRGSVKRGSEVGLATLFATASDAIGTSEGMGGDVSDSTFRF
jgi:hypothetical protein